MIATCLTLLLLTGPPADTDGVRDRVRELTQLSQKTDRASIDALLRVVVDAGAKWERLVALKLMREHHKRKGLPVLKRLLRAKDIDLQTEATIRLHQWAPTQTSLIALRGLRDRGVNLRRAFEVRQERGRPLYRPDAAEFFLESLSHDNVYTSLDGALGLVEIGLEPARSVALSVFEKVLASNDAERRRVAVHYMHTSFREPGFLPLIQAACEDSDDRVRRLAEALLSRQ